MGKQRDYMILALAVILTAIGVVLNSVYWNGPVIKQFPLHYFAEFGLSTGIFAVGTFAIGVFSIGIFSIGIFSIGIFSIGFFSIGLFVIAKHKETVKIRR